MLFHRDLGGAGRPRLVILHGMLGSSRNWQTVGRELADAFHVQALDLRNHGGSPHAEPMTYAAMAEDVLGWLDAQAGAAPVTLLGHSMGGKVAMLLACRHPARVRRLIVVDIAPRDYHSEPHRAEFAAMTELRLEELPSRAEAERGLEARVPDWAMRKFLTTNLERAEDGRWRWIINLPVLSAALPELERDALRKEDQFAGATLFVTGGKSRYVTAEDHAAVRRHFPAAEIVTMPDAGHNPHMEAREAFVATVRAHAVH